MCLSPTPKRYVTTQYPATRSALVVFEDVGDFRGRTDRTNVRFHDFFSDTIFGGRGGVIIAEVSEDASAFCDGCIETYRVDELDCAVIDASGNDFVRCQLEIEILFQEQFIHECDDLNDELVLS